jgi:Ala-tRNA(Pro) deacylase
LAKAVVFRSERGFVMAVVPGDREVDTEKFRERIGASNVRIASEEELVRLFHDIEPGAMPPFGNLYGLHVYVDNELAQVPTIAFNAGTHTDVVYMDYADFERLVCPFVFPISRAKKRSSGA